MCNSFYAWSSISSAFVQAVNLQPLIAEARFLSQVVDRLALGQTLLQVIQYSPVSIILQCSTLISTIKIILPQGKEG
jgi:hypothetical protein